MKNSQHLKLQENWEIRVIAQMKKLRPKRNIIEGDLMLWKDLVIFILTSSEWLSCKLLFYLLSFSGFLICSLPPPSSPRDRGMGVHWHLLGPVFYYEKHDFNKYSFSPRKHIVSRLIISWTSCLCVIKIRWAFLNPSFSAFWEISYIAIAIIVHTF